MDLFRKACISPTAVSVNEVVDAMQLYRYWIGYVFFVVLMVILILQNMKRRNLTLKI